MVSEDLIDADDARGVIQCACYVPALFCFWIPKPCAAHCSCAVPTSSLQTVTGVRPLRTCTACPATRLVLQASARVCLQPSFRSTRSVIQGNCKSTQLCWPSVSLGSWPRCPCHIVAQGAVHADCAALQHGDADRAVHQGEAAALAAGALQGVAAAHRFWPKRVRMRHTSEAERDATRKLPGGALQPRMLFWVCWAGLPCPRSATRPPCGSCTEAAPWITRTLVRHALMLPERRWAGASAGRHCSEPGGACIGGGSEQAAERQGTLLLPWTAAGYPHSCKVPRRCRAVSGHLWLIQRCRCASGAGRRGTGEPKPVGHGAALPEWHRRADVMGSLWGPRCMLLCVWGAAAAAFPGERRATVLCFPSFLMAGARRMQHVCVACGDTVSEVPYPYSSQQDLEASRNARRA